MHILRDRTKKKKLKGSNKINVSLDFIFYAVWRVRRKADSQQMAVYRTARAICASVYREPDARRLRPFCLIASPPLQSACFAVNG